MKKVLALVIYNSPKLLFSFGFYIQILLQNAGKREGKITGSPPPLYCNKTGDQTSSSSQE